VYKSFVLLFISFAFSFSGDSLIVNKHLNHSSIISAFVIIDEFSIQNAPLDSTMNLSFWQEIYEETLLKQGYNVITRSKIAAILDEQKLSLSGLTTEKDSYKIGKLISADAVLFVNVRESSEGTIWESVRLIKIDTGEIALMGTIKYLPQKKYPKGEHPSDKRDELFARYKIIAKNAIQTKKQ
jgi:hypothetical protein